MFNRKKREIIRLNTSLDYWRINYNCVLGNLKRSQRDVTGLRKERAELLKANGQLKRELAALQAEYDKLEKLYQPMSCECQGLREENLRLKHTNGTYTPDKKDGDPYDG